MASEVVDADGFCGPAAEACGEAEVVLAAVEEGVPLVLAGGMGGERLALEEFWDAMDWLLDLRVEPTNLRKRWFMDDMET